MSQLLNIEIAESVEILKEKLKKETNPKKQTRLPVIYWIKTKQAESVRHLAGLAGIHRTTVSRWLSQYRKGGLSQLLTIKTSSGRTRVISAQIEAKLDESRMGLITLWSRKITGKGIQPVGVEQWCFDYFWLYGLVEPRSGESFWREFSHLDSICFEKYLELFAQEYPDDLHIIQLDNGRLHTAKSLKIPENIVLIFQPPYCPQVNPIERLWQEIKKHLKWSIFEELNELRDSLKKILNDLTPQDITSLTFWDFLKEALFVANI
jgi:transposase